MSDIATTSAAPQPRKSRGANPSADYKSLFLKSKDKYDRVSTDHTELKTNVAKAAAKQQKLREELDYLLDAVASKRAQRAHIEQSHRDRALELEREAAAAVAAAAAARQQLSKRDREAYEPRSTHRGYQGAEEYRGYSARYAEPSYPAFGSGVNRRYASPPPALVAPVGGARNVSVGSQRGGERYPTSEGSPQGAVLRDPSAAGSYRHGPSQSPPSLPRSHPHEPQSSPSRYEGHSRYRESTPPLAPTASASAVKRPRPTSVERELLETDEAYDIDPRDRAHQTKRARND